MLNPDHLFTPEEVVAAVSAHPLPWFGPDPAGCTVRVPQSQLLEWANRWEPDASASPPAYREATCVSCGEPMVKMWHLWLADGGFKKECHLCWTCGLPWMS